MYKIKLKFVLNTNECKHLQQTPTNYLLANLLPNAFASNIRHLLNNRNE